jgi:microcystin-dependent protein
MSVAGFHLAAGAGAGKVLTSDADGSGSWQDPTGGAPPEATYITQTPDASLPNAQALSTLGNGVLKNTAGVLGIAAGSDLPAHNHATGDLNSGQVALDRGGTHADLSAAGPGFLKQASQGADVTVTALALADLPDGATAGVPLLAGGAAGDPAYGQLDLSQSAAIKNALPLANLTDGATAGQPLVAGGSGGDPNYAALDLAGTSVVTGLLPLANGGTGADLHTTGGSGQYVKQAGAGAALTVGAIAQADVPLMTGDSGSGGVRGAVPAPGTGDAAAGKFLKADATWAVPPGSGGATIPAGAMQMYGGSSAPDGWLLCDGSAVSRTTYAALFTAIGTAFGVGDGSTTFNVPDVRGRAPIGVGQGSGLTNRALAASGGEETHVLTVAELASHQHGHANMHDGDKGGICGGPGTAVYSGFTGSGTAHNTMQPWLAVNFIIKT